MSKSYTIKRSGPRGGFHAERRRRRTLAALAALAAALVLAIIGIRLERAGAFARLAAGKPVPKNEVLATWELREWDRVMELCTTSLASAPLDSFYLGMKGLASYYKAMDLPEGEGRATLIDGAVVLLRKALATGGGGPRSEMEYVLGKAYFRKGRPWWDVSIAALEGSIAKGRADSDAREYLAVAYAGLGDTAKAVTWFTAALEGSRADLLLLAAARAHADNGDEGRAEALLLEVLASSKDALAREKARFVLSELYAARGEARRSEEQVSLALEENPESAEAHFRLGLSQQKSGDLVRARAEWRRAVALDPMHAAARQKLAERP